MADRTGSIDLNLQNSSDRSLLALANEVSNDILGRDAGTQGRPTKSDIIREINRVQRDICNKHKDWTFLVDSSTFKGYDLDSTTTNESSTSTLDLNISSGSNGVGDISYYANKVILDTIGVPSIVTFNLMQNAGFGNAGATITAYVYTGDEGTPESVFMTSSTIVVTDGLTDTGVQLPNDGVVTNALPVEFTFANSENEELENGVDYWIVLKIEYTTDVNGISPIAENTTSENTYTILTGESTWTQVANREFYYSLDYYVGTLASEFSLDLNIRRILRLYPYGTSNSLLEFANTLYIANESRQENNTYVIRKTNASENLTIVVKSNDSPVDWSIDFTKKTPVLSADSDISVIPEDFRDLLTMGAYIKLFDKGLVTAQPQVVNDMHSNYKSMFRDLEFDYRSPFTQFELEEVGQTSRDDTYGKQPNRFEVTR